MTESKKILIIEQEALVALDLKRELEKKIFTIIRANSMIISELIISNKKIDIVIASTDMQRQPFFDKLKSVMKKCQTPLIWIGTLSDIETMKKSEGMNVIGTFLKPFNSKDVVNYIINFIDQKIKSSFKRKM